MPYFHSFPIITSLYSLCLQFFLLGIIWPRPGAPRVFLVRSVFLPSEALDPPRHIIVLRFRVQYIRVVIVHNDSQCVQLFSPIHRPITATMSIRPLLAVLCV